MENVAGFNTRQKASGLTPAEEVRTKLHQMLGSVSVSAGWEVELHPYNTLDYGLPHSRPRVFMLFRRRACYPLGTPEPPRVFARRIPLGQLLETTPRPDVVGTGGAGYTDTFQENL